MISVMTDERHDQPVSFVLRVLPGPAARGQLIGHLELVSTGDVVAVRDGDDVAALVCRLASAHTPSA